MGNKFEKYLTGSHPASELDKDRLLDNQIAMKDDPDNPGNLIFAGYVGSLASGNVASSGALRTVDNLSATDVTIGQIFNITKGAYFIAANIDFTALITYVDGSTGWILGNAGEIHKENNNVVSIEILALERETDNGFFVYDGIMELSLSDAANRAYLLSKLDVNRWAQRTFTCSNLFTALSGGSTFKMVIEVPAGYQCFIHSIKAEVINFAPNLAYKLRIQSAEIGSAVTGGSPVDYDVNEVTGTVASNVTHGINEDGDFYIPLEQYTIVVIDQTVGINTYQNFQVDKIPDSRDLSNQPIFLRNPGETARHIIIKGTLTDVLSAGSDSTIDYNVGMFYSISPAQF
jgi:hypothetical protein